MKQVLILGVNGFIGRHLSKRILETTDWEVYGMGMYSERVTDLMGKPQGSMAGAPKDVYEAYCGQVAAAHKLVACKERWVEARAAQINNDKQQP